MQNIQFLWSNVEQQIAEVIQQLNEAKAQSNKKTKKILLTTAAILAVLSLVRILHPLVALGILLVFWLSLLYYYRYKRNVVYKTKVVPQLVQTVCPGATYSAKGTLTKDIFKGAGMYRTGWGEEFKNEDTIRGKVGETDFVYGEVELYHMQQTGKSAVKVVDFKGFIFEADFNKYFQGVTMLTSDIGFMSKTQPGIFSKMKRCIMEDVNFERMYNTYSTNDQEARYILTPALQHRIMEMNRTFATQLGDKHLSISFRANRMLIAVPSDTDRFEVKYDLDSVKRDLLAISVMIDVIEQLNLNLRIWSKE